MSAVVEIRAPAEQTEGTRSQVLKWLKTVGETVSENEPLIEIETDKVTVEVASPGSGVLREILKREQEEIEPGELLGRIASAQSATAVQRGSLEAEGAYQPAQSAAARALDTQTSAGAAASNDSAISASAQPDRSAAGTLSPAVRRLLAEHQLEPTAVRGSGQGGRITVQDVLQFVAGRAATEATGPSAGRESRGETAPSRPGIEESGLGPSRSVAHTAIRKRIAEHMVQSLLHTAPHVTTVFEADLSAVLEHRQRHKDDFARRGVPLTLTAYFLQAAVVAIRAVPEANSRWTDSALQIFDSIHIGVATALDSGLVVPVLRDVQSRDLFGIAQGLEELIARARAGQLTPADVRGGTFTISNHGVSGSLVATPIIINQPQSAILGVGKLEKRAVVLTDGSGEERIGIRPRCYVTLTLDHRVMDGHQANRFLQTFVQRLAASPS
jgi:2-oxoglutarate dehydrogenase E2 component (dihydrolipoamide succinyltransferase)